MARTIFTSVDDYIAAQPPAVQRLLARVREVIRKTVPAAEESISYGIPTYKLDGRPMLYFAGFKQHYSLYPATRALVSALKNELAPYDYNGKGTIRFPLDALVPARVIAAVAKHRAREVKEMLETRKSKTASRSARRP
jgi:uncharacterized protein YdhG (YjbR/CyaY superfamily)